jgi:hypothetical protein
MSQQEVGGRKQEAGSSRGFNTTLASAASYSLPPNASSRWQDIFLHLKENDLEVRSPGMSTDIRSPGTGKGECVSPYIVLKNDGSTRRAGISTNVDLYSVMCYVPKQSYSELEVLVQKVKAVMKKLEPMILPYGSETPSYYDDDVKAHMISIEYKNYKKML